MTSGCRPKLETQLARIGNPTDDDWICTSRVSVVLGDRMKTWPRQLMRDHDRVTAYVARKPHLRGRGFIQASTLVFPRTLGLRVPFDHQQGFHQDVDWLVSVDEQVMDLRVYQCPEALTEYWVAAGTVSGRITANDSSAWARSRLAGDPRSYGDFLLSTSTVYAARSGEPRTTLRIIGRGIRSGRPGVPALVYSLFQVASAVRNRLLRARR